MEYPDALDLDENRDTGESRAAAHEGSNSCPPTSHGFATIKTEATGLAK